MRGRYSYILPNTEIIYQHISYLQINQSGNQQIKIGNNNTITITLNI